MSSAPSQVFADTVIELISSLHICLIISNKWSESNEKKDFYQKVVSKPFN